MLWDKRPRDDKDLPEELRGKSPEELAESLRKAKELEQQVASLTADKVKLENDFSAVRTETETTKQKLSELEARFQQPQPRQQQQQTQTEDEVSIWTDPQKFVEQQLKPTQDVAVISGIMSAKLFAQNGLSPRDRKIWTKYEKEIEKAMEGYAPVQRMVPNNWIMALTLVKGQHDVEIAKHESASTDFFAEPVSHGQGPSSSVTRGQEDDGNKLTDEEEEIVKAMHWNRDGYLAQKKKMVVNQSTKGAYARLGI